MSNEVSIFKNQTTTPAKREGKLSPLAQKLASSGLTTRRMQTNTNGTFRRIINGEQIGDAIRSEINVIIVNALPKVSRIFYKEKYDPDGEPTLPNCWSNQGDKPESGVPDAQHENCADCPQNIKGSGEKDSRACRYQRRIAMLIEGDPSGDIYQFNVPAKSLFGKGSGNVHPFEGYIKYLLANDESPDNVVTNISYDINADSMELLFTPMRNINDAELHLATEAQSKPEADIYTKITVAQADGVTKEPIKDEAPVVTRSDEPEDEEEIEIAEPIKRASNNGKEAVTAEDPELSAVIKEWATGGE